MVINSDLRDQAYEFFIEEAEELLQQLESGLLDLRSDRSTPKVHSLMRAAHSIKGGAASVGLETIKDLSHRLEDIFKALYNETVEIDRELETNLLQAYDCLRDPLLTQIEMGEFDEAAAIEKAEPVFARIEAQLGSALDRADDYIPSSSDLGVDIVSSIFEIDVAQGIEHLETVLANPENYEIAGELRAQAEVFAGFGELLNLPGFSAIAKAATAALDPNSDRVLEIIELMLVDLRQARQMVMEGDRSSGGTPSQALLALAEANSSTSAPVVDNTTHQEIEPSFGFSADSPEHSDRIVEQNLEEQNPSLDEVFGQDIEEKINAELAELDPEEASANPSLDAVFGSEVVEHSARFDLITEEASANPSLDEVFARDIEEKINAELAGLDTEAASANPSLDEVFGSEIVADSDRFDLITEEASANPSLDEIFGQDIEEKINAELAELEPEETEENISLDAVFGSEVESSARCDLSTEETLENPSLDEAIEQDIEEKINAELAELDPEETEEDISLDAVFGSEVESSARWDLTTEESLENPALDEISPEKLEEKINAELARLAPEESLENIALDRAFLEDVEEKINAELAANKNILSQQESHKEYLERRASEVLEETGDLEEEEEIEAEINISENIEETVQSIEQIFDRLPSIQENSNKKESLLEQKTGAKSEEAERKTEPTIEVRGQEEETKTEKRFKKRTNKKRSSSKRSSSGLSVRVDIERLEKMNNLVGELAIERNSLSLQNQQLQATVRELLNRFAQFRNKTDRLQEISDKMLVSPNNKNRDNNNSGTQFDRILAGETDFDSLEMDSYGATYSALQDVIEEIIQLEEAVDDVVLYSKQSDRSIDKQRQMLNYLRDELMWSRMLPLGEVFNRFPRLIRDMSLQFNKSVALKITGTGVLVDKAVLEKLYDPLLHLLRNAFDHGIEYPEDRAKQGKDEEGKIEISAYHQGNQTFIEIKDDGGGLKEEKIANRAIELGWLTPEEAANTSKAEILEFIFKPGFSTASQVSELSGRGVGLDVVLSQLQSLKGKISVNSAPGEGTTFTLRLPLTLTISKLLVCLSGSDAIALPSDSIEEIIIPRSSQIKEAEGKTSLKWQMQEIPAYRLQELLEYNYPLPNSSPSEIFNNTIPTPQSWASPLLLLRQGQQMFALEVDRIVTEQELVIKPFGTAIAPPNYLYGCTIMGDGSLVPVINGSILLSHCFEEDVDRELTIDTSVGSKSPRDKQKRDRHWKVTTILIVDDSSALRRTLALSLQKANYRVLQAKDGKEALDKLEQHPQVNLIVCDIEMPNMNGFEFLSYRRQKPQIANIPIAMLTSRSSKKHRQLATQLGANAYFSKPYVELEFLKAIEEIIKETRSSTIPAEK